MSIQVADICKAVRGRTDKANSGFIDDTVHLLPWADESHQELYENVETLYGGQYFMQAPTLSVVAGSEKTSIASFTIGNRVYVPWKLVRIDIELQGYREPMRMFDWSTYIMDTTPRGWSRGSEIKYNWSGTDVWWQPIPVANNTVRVHFVPKCKTLSALSDTIESSLEPWVDYVILDMCIKVAQKERDHEAVASFAGQKSALWERVKNTAPPRDVGQAERVRDVQNLNEWQPNGWLRRGWPA